MKILILSVIIVGALAHPSLAQPSRPSVPARVSDLKIEKQWEYLIVSPGKVYFSNPLTDEAAKTSGKSKLLNFSNAGLFTGSEGISTQTAIDVLGKFGWELVAVVGAIGGDQEMVFKRPFDPQRSEKEAEMIRNEGELLRKIKEAEFKQSTTTNVLVDLDAEERRAAVAATRKSQEVRLRTVIDELKNPDISVDYIFSSADSPEDVDVSASLSVDGTEELLSDGNKYRSSEAERFASSTADIVFRAAGLKRNQYSEYLGHVRITVHVFINFGGKREVVATVRRTGDW